MPFNLRESIGAVNHLIVRWDRSFFRRPSNFHLQQFEVSAALDQLVIAVDIEKHEAVCAICGYRLVKLEIVGGWTLETCSAVGIKEVLARPNLRDWLLGLPGCADAAGNLKQIAAKLPESVV